jgi:glycosyltransferase involved in cell wall biosynthesis
MKTLGHLRQTHKETFAALLRCSWLSPSHPHEGIFSAASMPSRGPTMQTACLSVFYYAEHTSRLDANTGLQRVTRMLARSLLETGCKLVFVEWSPTGDHLVVSDINRIDHLCRWNGPALSEAELQFYYINSGKPVTALFGDNLANWHLLVPEVTHITHHASPITADLIAFAKSRSISVSFIFHDDIPLHRPELQHIASVHAEYMKQLARADAVYAISQTSLSNLLSFWTSVSDDIEGALCFCEPLPAESVLAARQRATSTINASNIILSVGSITAHKNQITLCNAFADAQDRGLLTDWELVLVGHCSQDVSSELSNFATRYPSIRHIPGGSDTELGSLYKRCAFTVFPSFTEGFGLPIVESLWFGKPCITASTGAPFEIASTYRGCFTTDTSNVKDLQSALLALATNPSLLEDMAASIHHQPLPTWSDYSHRIQHRLRTIGSSSERTAICDNTAANHKPRPLRLFWLGMHKILVRTELERLRMLGLEVFNPPYLSTITDQSAELDWNNHQHSTLPMSVLRELSSTNFFYNDASSNIADILSSYFDAVVVTINPTWLRTILQSYQGPIIFRTYGQAFNISRECDNLAISHTLQRLRSFAFMPHTALTLDDEDQWLKERALAIPYCLTDDVFGYQDSWRSETAATGEVGLTCPNIANQYYAAHYEYIKTHYSKPRFKLFGVQTTEVQDPSVVGTLPRWEQLERFQHLSCYLYTYHDKNVCYLPPIEAMVMGIPVLFPQGCLLDRYFGDQDAPGRYNSEDHALELIQRIHIGDIPLITRIVESQSAVRQLYTPSYVWPRFDDAFKDTLCGSVQRVP